MSSLHRGTAKRYLERMMCCGKGMHSWCFEGIHASSLSFEQKNAAQRTTSHEESIEQVQRWVEEGKAWAQSNLGQHHAHGLGVDQSYQQAKESFELAASQGDADAQSNLGVIYIEGQGVDQSYERAKEYFEAAARQGLAQAQYSLGSLYVHGQGVEQSYETAQRVDDAISSARKRDGH